MGLMDKLFGKQHKKAPPAQVVEEEPVQVVQPPAPPEEENSAAEAVLLPRLEDELLELWDRWSGSALPPILSLAGDMDPNSLPLNAETLSEEQMRLAVRLGQDAKERSRKLAELEKKNEEQEEEKEEQTPVSMDAECKCYLSKSLMMAWVFVFPPIGEGKGINANSIGGTLEKNGVKTGIDQKAIISLLGDSYFRLVPVAIGTPPVEGTDGYVVEHFPREVVHEVCVKEDGTADYRTQNYVKTVQAGELICDMVLPVPGQNGCRVDGTVAEARKVNPAKVPRGKNTKFSEDGLQLLAGETGHLIYHNSVFQVMKVFEVPGDVDYSCGNIDFPGDVHIQGDVRDGFEVKAQGSILVDGMVEGASLEAGEDIIIARGVVGDNRAVLRCGHDLKTKYIESCELYVGGCLYADSIIMSDIFCDDSIQVENGRGSIIGGSITVARRLRAKVIGARSGRITRVVLGVSAYLQKQLEEIRHDLEECAKEKKQNELDITYLSGFSGDENIKQRLTKAKFRRSSIEMREIEFTKRLKRLEEEGLDLAQCQIDADIIYPVTKVSIGERTWTLDIVHQDYRARFNKKTGELTEC